MISPTPYQLLVLQALQAKPVYQGTVTQKNRLTRRAKNRVAKQSRKANR